MDVFGPVPSRRLGQSLGINHIPPKTCPYSCIYCQLGRTDRLSVTRQVFADPDAISRKVGQVLGMLHTQDKTVDYLTFVPDGEPTLDSRLGQSIERLKAYKIPIAVISNASLLWMKEVREDLARADWVSVKIDAATPSLWHRINRPHRSLQLTGIFAGIEEFAQMYQGTLVTETMLVAGYNDTPEQIEAIARQISRIHPRTAYLLVPSRPPAESYVHKPEHERLLAIAKTLTVMAGVPVSLMAQDEAAEDFFFGQEVIVDLLKIIAVHPVREDVIKILIEQRGFDSTVLEWLIRQNLVLETTYEGRRYFRKNIQLEAHQTT